MPSEEFNKAAAEAKEFASKPSDAQLLKLYGLYKQATDGDNKTPKPSFYELKAAAKWNAWNDLQGKDKEEAEKEYIAFVQELKGTHGAK